MPKDPSVLYSHPTAAPGQVSPLAGAMARVGAGSPGSPTAMHGKAGAANRWQQFRTVMQRPPGAREAAARTCPRRLALAPVTVAGLMWSRLGLRRLALADTSSYVAGICAIQVPSMAWLDWKSA